MKDKSFKLDSLRDLPRYVSKGSYQTILDDKSGYDHILMTEESRTCFGFQWAGWYFTYCILSFWLENIPICLPYYWFARHKFLAAFHVNITPVPEFIRLLFSTLVMICENKLRTNKGFYKM